MNEYESDQASKMLEEKGYSIVKHEKDADIVIFNTCSVREHAENRVFGQLGILKKLKKKKKDLVIGIMGCMASAYGKDLLKKYKHLDFVVGTQDAGRIPEMVETVLAKRKQQSFLNTEYQTSSFSRFMKGPSKLKAYIPIMRGCDNFCSYCIVPYVRGREMSRPVEEIIDEITFLTEHGVKEVMLLGQNVNSYGKGLTGGLSFPELLNRVSEVREVKVIRFMTSHPKDVSQELFEVMKKNPKIEKHLHLPLQSGSDRMLRSMNRQYTMAEYRRDVEAVRKLIPDVSLTTDIIVGFCGETQEDFDATYRVMEELKFDSAFIFKYSPRKGTKAFDLADDVPLKEKEERHKILFDAQKEWARSSNERFLNRTVPVFVEGISKKQESHVKGRTIYDKEVVFPGTRDLVGTVVPVQLLELRSETFIGVKG